MSVRHYIFEGHGRSAHALAAEAQGGMPATRAARTIGLKNPRWVPDLFPLLGIYEVGKYGMHVRYYDLSDRGYHAMLRRHYEPTDHNLRGTANRLADLLAPYFSKRGAAALRSRLTTVAATTSAKAA